MSDDHAGFIVYPSEPTVIGDTIERAVTSFRDRGFKRRYETWPELDIPGRFIAEQVLERISSAGFVVGDISRLNFNVTYEIGYAIGLGLRVFVVKNRMIEPPGNEHRDVGIFDTIGYHEYSNSEELLGYLREYQPGTSLNIAFRKNIKAPVYLNQGKYRTDIEATIISRIKKARLHFRSFDPNESPRLSAHEAIQNVAQSYGVVLHFHPDEIAGSRIHNLRSAFLAGLSHGMNCVTLLIQWGDSPVPIDYRDFVEVCRDPNRIKEVLADFAERVTEALQEESADVPEQRRGLLERLYLGASSAENEMTALGQYYLEIEAFRRGQRKEVRLITGRKGSGKTAIFFRLRDYARKNKSHVVLDLKPDGYQLLKFKDMVLSIMATGTVEHTITAFWEYLLLLELCYKLLEKDQELHKRNHRLFAPYQRLSASYIGDEYVSEGDFSERMSRLLREIGQDFQAKYVGRNRGAISLSQPEITDLLYRHDVARLRGEVQEYLKFKGEVWLLFDNLDKGWPTHGLKAEDLVIIRTLIEATRKIEREFAKNNIDAHTVVFLRNDVYELLVNETPDRGKEARANVDWTDAELLRELLKRRIAYSQSELKDKSFEQVWHMLCIPLVDGEESSQYVIDRCLMRPRCLIDLVNLCRGRAVDLGHEKIEKEDILNGLKAYSTDLISEISLEIRDIYPEGENVLYAFIGAPKQLNHEALSLMLNDAGIAGAHIENVCNILFWFGFLGLVWPNGDINYIYSVNYDMRYFQGARRKFMAEGIAYQINEAFWSGLGITEQ